MYDKVQLCMTKCVKVSLAEQSKARQSNAWTNHGLGSNRSEPVIGPCFAMICFDRNALTHFVIQTGRRRCEALPGVRICNPLSPPPSRDRHYACSSRHSQHTATGAHHVFYYMYNALVCVSVCKYSKKY